MCTLNTYLSIINKSNMHDTNIDWPTTTAASLIFKLSSMFENSVTNVCYSALLICFSMRLPTKVSLTLDLLVTIATEKIRSRSS